jgi:hypothetical protein
VARSASPRASRLASTRSGLPVLDRLDSTPGRRRRRQRGGGRRSHELCRSARPAHSTRCRPRPRPRSRTGRDARRSRPAGRPGPGQAGDRGRSRLLHAPPPVLSTPWRGGRPLSILAAPHLCGKRRSSHQAEARQSCSDAFRIRTASRASRCAAEASGTTLRAARSSTTRSRRSPSASQRRSDRAETPTERAATPTGTPCASISVRSSRRSSVSFDGLPATPPFWPLRSSRVFSPKGLWGPGVRPPSRTYPSPDDSRSRCFHGPPFDRRTADDLDGTRRGAVWGPAVRAPSRSYPSLRASDVPSSSEA